MPCSLPHVRRCSTTGQGTRCQLTLSHASALVIYSYVTNCPQIQWLKTSTLLLLMMLRVDWLSRQLCWLHLSLFCGCRQLEAGAAVIGARLGWSTRSVWHLSGTSAGMAGGPGLTGLHSLHSGSGLTLSL